MASTSVFSTTSISIDDILQQLSVGITPTRSAINDAIHSLQAHRDIANLLHYILFNNSSSMLLVSDYQYENNYYFIILLKCLRYNNSIWNLNVDAKMDGDLMKEFSTMLGHNRYIKKLTIFAPISQQSEEYLIEALKMNTSLDELYIHLNPYEEHNHFVIQNILKYLKLNTTITKLELSIYDFSGIDIDRICNILIHNSTLENLYLGNCYINVDDVNRIISCLKYNANLQKLLLHGNESNIDTINVIADVLKYNNTIDTIHIDFIDDPSDAIDDQANDNNINSDVEKYNDAITNLSESIYQNISIQHLHGITLTPEIKKNININIDNSNIRYRLLLNTLLGLL